MELTLPDIEAYLDFLLNGDRIFCGVWMDEALHKPVSGYGKGKHGDLRNFLLQYEELKSPLVRGWPGEEKCQAPTLHITLNSLPVGAERGNANWEDCRVLCLDLDRSVDKFELQTLITDYTPHLVIESSPSKFHVYWKVAPCFGTRDWKSCWSIAQATIADYFKGDKCLRSIAKLIRVPGFPRLTKDGSPFVPRIVYKAPTVLPLTYQDMPKVFPWFKEQSKLVGLEQDKTYKNITREVMQHIDLLNKTAGYDIHQIKSLGEGKIDPGDRNNALYQYVYRYVFIEDCSPKETALYAKLILERFSVPYPMHEAIPTINSAFNAAKRGIAKKKAKLAKALEIMNRLDAEGAHGN